jgi:hypothetical protein
MLGGKLKIWWFITDQGPGFKFGSLISLANQKMKHTFYVGILNGASQSGSVGGMALTWYLNRI